MFVEDFNPSQRRRFFRCNPVRLVWTTLWPAIEIIRNSENAGPGLAAAFEALADQYQQWTETADGRDYRTESQQAVCALFF
jgi:hypothetical protein